MPHVLALRTNGTLWAWGGNRYGQLGNGTTTDRLKAKQLGTGTWTAVAAGGWHTFGLVGAP